MEGVEEMELEESTARGEKQANRGWRIDRLSLTVRSVWAGTVMFYDAGC